MTLPRHNLQAGALLMKTRQMLAENDEISTFSFVHTADLHLDSPFIGISGVDPKLGERLAKATFQAYETIIELCIERKVDFLLIAGDVYDSTDKSLYAQVKFIEGLKKLNAAGVQAYICHGNHDPLEGWSASLLWPENVHVMSGKSIERLEIEKNGETAAIVVGRSYLTQRTTTNLVKSFPKKEEKWPFTIGLLHCSVGNCEGHEPYAPCTIQDLKDLNYNYWALGHIHTPSIICKEDPVAIYPGNPQGRNSGETGARGCYFVKVEAGEIVSTEFIETDSIRWYIREVSIESLENEGKLIELLSNQLEDIRENSEGRAAICRLVLKGRGPLHRSLRNEGFLEEILQILREDESPSQQFVWVERIEDKTRFPIERSFLLKREDFVGDVVKISELLRNDLAARDKFLESLNSLFNSKSGRKFISKIDDKEMDSLLQRAENILLDTLLVEEKHEN